MIEAFAYSLLVPNLNMSEISAEEKKRILRERRQAKMKQGLASDRLNNILSQGSSVKEQTAVSVLDKPSAPNSSQSTTGEHLNADADPGVLDLDALLAQRNVTPPIANTQEPDFDEMLSKIFGNQAGAAPNGAAGNTQDDPIAAMMANMFSQQGGGGIGGLPDFGQANGEEADSYNTQLKQYNVYQQKLWKFRFLIIRFIVTLSNFYYHYLTIDDLSFQASSHSYVRGLVSTTPTGSFITTFLSAELVILTSYYIIGSKYNLFKFSGENNFIVKILSMGSMFLPQVAQFQPLIIRILGYWEIFGIFLGDTFLIVLLFGLTSYYR